MRPKPEESDAQRIAEVILLAPQKKELTAMLQAVCPVTREVSPELVLGFLPVNRELTLFCYGVRDPEHFAWELVGRKMLGYVVAFDWGNADSFSAGCRCIDFTAAHFAAPFVVAADHGVQPLPVPESAVRPPIMLSTASRFVFFQSHKAASVRRLFVTLLDMLLEKLE